MILLQNLIERHAVELFMSRAGNFAKFPAQEVLDLVLQDPQLQQSPDSLKYLRGRLSEEDGAGVSNFDVDDAFDAGITLTEEQRSRLLELLADENVQKEALERHNMFKLMNGNPRSVITFAYFYKMKLLPKTCLSAIYNLILNDDKPFGNRSAN